MTYNIHSCINIRRKSDINAIADIISPRSPDVVALQEVDVRKKRTGRIDQVGIIAERLGMTPEFYPLVRKGNEAYGLGILSRLPVEVIKCGRLPARNPQGGSEPRGAMWIRIEAPGGMVNFVNTHLGLTPKDRFLQIRALFGKEWGLGIPENQPVIFCGDFNAGVRSAVYRKITSCLLDVQKQAKQSGYPKATFFSMYPMVRIDHIFISKHLHPVFVEVPSALKARTASDHLPVFAELTFAKKVHL
ncbi:MAG: endonuclease/exonuclease/phosphatase family protein [Desulfobacterales bacterium]